MSKPDLSRDWFEGSVLSQSLADVSAAGFVCVTRIPCE